MYPQLSAIEVNLAVVSRTVLAALGEDVLFEFDRWTWRLADAGKDAADHELRDFAVAALRQRPGARVAVASGDHIFADLARETEIAVIVPRGHHGVAKVLRPHLRVRNLPVEYRLAS
ncbi:MAG: hypothetical protein U0R64_01920 [Candidatus Nanopelagicales bacterium]